MVTIVPEPFDSPDGRRLNDAYFSELRTRFPAGYDPAAGMPTLRHDLTPPNGIFYVAQDEEAVVACGALKVLDGTTGEVKHMYVQPGHRGRGIGAQILAAVEQHARSLGMTRVVLDTNGCLTEAVTMYEQKGYVSIEPYNDNEWATHWFSKELG